MKIVPVEAAPYIRQHRTVDTGRRAAYSIVSIAVQMQIAAISINVHRSSRTTVLHSEVESSGAKYFV